MRVLTFRKSAMLLSRGLFLVAAFAVLSRADVCTEKNCTCTTTKGVTDVNCRALDLTIMPNFTSVQGTIFLIDMSRNRINSIPILHEIDGLKTLKLNNNEIREILPDAFKEFKYLENIDLSHNQLSNLSGLQDLTGLRYLNLSHNMVRSIPPNVFLEIRELVELRLTGNPLHYVRYDMFRSLSKVTTLDLSECALSTLPDDVFHDMLALKELELSSNHFERVPSTGLRSASKLKTLKFNKNGIHSITDKSFSKLNHLEILELSDMGTLEEIRPGAFSGLKLLKVLRIARNPQLKVLDFGAFNGLYSDEDELWTLQELILRDNGLETIRSPSTTLCRVHTLDLQGNPWKCDCLLTWTTSCELRDELASELMCSSPPDMEGRLINKLGAEDMVCPPDLHLEQHQKVLRVVVISCGLIGIVFCLAIILMIIKKRKIMEWWYYRKRGSGAVYYAKAKSNPQDA